MEVEEVEWLFGSLVEGKNSGSGPWSSLVDPDRMEGLPKGFSEEWYVAEEGLGPSDFFWFWKLGW